MTNEEKHGIEVLETIINFLILPTRIFLNGVVVSTMWNWYMVPKFELANLSIAEAILIMILIGLLAKDKTNTAKKLNEYGDASDAIRDRGSEILATAVFPFFMLGIFWVVMQFL